MRYSNLTELVRHSRSSAQYFFSLPPDIQKKLEEYGALIHTARDLQEAANAADIYEQEVEDTDHLAFTFWRKR